MLWQISRPPTSPREDEAEAAATSANDASASSSSGEYDSAAPSGAQAAASGATIAPVDKAGAHSGGQHGRTQEHGSGADSGDSLASLRYRAGIDSTMVSAKLADATQTHAQAQSQVQPQAQAAAQTAQQAPSPAPAKSASASSQNPSAQTSGKSNTPASNNATDVDSMGQPLHGPSHYNAGKQLGKIWHSNDSLLTKLGKTASWSVYTVPDAKQKAAEINTRYAPDPRLAQIDQMESSPLGTIFAGVAAVCLAQVRVRSKPHSTWVPPLKVWVWARPAGVCHSLVSECRRRCRCNPKKQPSDSTQVPTAPPRSQRLRERAQTMLTTL